MRFVLSALLLAACGGASAPATPDAPVAAEAPAAKAAGWETFGTPYEVSEAVLASKVLDTPGIFVGKPLMVEGQVADVCQKAGCWMVVTDGTERSIRVRMKDHGFAVAKDATGTTARVHGEVVAKELDPAEVAHFEGEAGRPEAMPEKALPADASVTYELIATAVQIKR